MGEDIKDAQSELDALEAPKHRAEHARHDLDTLKNMAVPSNEKLRNMYAEVVKEAEAELVAAKVDFDEHEEAHKEIGAGSLVKNIDQAAQAVLDARGEVHSDHPEYVTPAEG